MSDHCILNYCDVQATNGNKWRWLKVGLALFLGLVGLAALLPGTGTMTADFPRGDPNLRHWGPFWVHPDSFFTSLGIVSVLTGLTIVGILRRNKFELAGWILLGLMILFVFLG